MICLDGEGQAARGAKVSVSTANRGAHVVLQREVDVGGVASFDALPPGGYRVDVSDGGWIAQTRHDVLVPDGARASATMHLERGAVIEGRLLHADGTPAKDQRYLEAEFLGENAPTDEPYTFARGGTFRLEGLAAGPWRIVVQSGRFGSMFLSGRPVLGSTEVLLAAGEVRALDLRLDAP